MRCLSGSDAKAFGKKRKAGPKTQPMPKEGTQLRQNWDILQASRGKACTLAGTTQRINNEIRYLEDFYGLDIRLVQRGHTSSRRVSTYVLAGEWFGRVYVDYIAEHLTHPASERAA